MQQPKAKILLVEDDASLGFVIRDSLEDQDYEVFFSPDGESGWHQFMRNNVDICLLDVMLPRKDGISLAEQIRKKNKEVPILFLTAKSMDEDRIAGFKAGGDDYITKPFNMEELLLRIEVFLKRTQKDADAEKQEFKLGRLRFDCTNFLLIDGKDKQQLTQKEADLLRYLCLNANRVVKREDVLLHVWGKEDYFLGRSMDVFMTKIRKFLKGVEKVDLQTVHGVGFKLILA